MRFKTITTVALVALLAIGATLLAQQPGAQRGQRGQGGQPGGGRAFGGGGMFGGGGFLRSRISFLNIAEVKKELELAEEQVAAIEKLDAELREKYPFGGRGGGGPGGGGQNRGKGGNGQGAVAPPTDWYFVQQNQQPGQGKGGRGNFQPPTPEEQARMAQQRLERAREERAKLAEILLPHQMKRLNEIFVQQNGVTALQDEEIATQLGISDAQKGQMTKIREEFDAKRREIFPGPGGGGGGGDIEARLAKMRELTTAQDEQLLGVLSGDQKAKFEAMKGKAFEMPEGAGRGGRGGPGGRGGQNRGKGGNNEA